MRCSRSCALLLMVAGVSRPAEGRTILNGYIPNAESLYPVVLGHGGAHVVASSGGNVDAFGRDLFNNSGLFHTSGLLSTAWARICALDSDGDGRSNGEELGDPACTWRPGQVSPPGPVSNPGVRDTAVVVSPPAVSSTPSARPPAVQPGAAASPGLQVRAPDERSGLFSATVLAIIIAAGVLVLLSVAVRASKAYNERKLAAVLAARGQRSAVDVPHTAVPSTSEVGSDIEQSGQPHDESSWDRAVFVGSLRQQSAPTEVSQVALCKV
jgi:hypothetical protein